MLFNEEYHKTIILITHDMGVVAHMADRVLVINDGNLLLDGTPDEIFAQVITALKERGCL